MDSFDSKLSVRQLDRITVPDTENYSLWHGRTLNSIAVHLPRNILSYIGFLFHLLGAQSIISQAASVLERLVLHDQRLPRLLCNSNADQYCRNKSNKPCSLLLSVDETWNWLVEQYFKYSTYNCAYAKLIACFAGHVKYFWFVCLAFVIRPTAAIQWLPLVFFALADCPNPVKTFFRKYVPIGLVLFRSWIFWTLSRINWLLSLSVCSYYSYRLWSIVTSAENWFSPGGISLRSIFSII